MIDRRPTGAPLESLARGALALLVLAPAAIWPAAGQPPAGQAAPEEQVVQVPAIDVGVNFLDSRRKSQLAAAQGWAVRHDFRFSDRQPESGISFEHRSVEDSLKTWKPVHYDHGNGVAVADVDGDGLHDLYFTSQLGGNQLWKNLGGGKFQDVTDEAGVRLAGRIGVTASFADVDNDGDPDLFVTSVRTGNVLFENDGTGRFKDISKQAGVDYSGHSSGAVFFDYDRDGLLDLFVTNVGVYTHDEQGPGGFWIGRADAFEGHLYPERAERSILYRNLGDGRFADVSQATGLVDDSWSGDATFVDFDRDLDPDLYVLNMQGDDHYWENLDGKSFAERTAKHFPLTSWGAMGVKFFDFDNDGRDDLLVTDMHSDMVPEGFEPLMEKTKKFGIMVEGGENNIPGNAFWVQQADGSFKELSDALGAENYWPWGLSVGDLNADGYEDAFIASSMNYPYRYGINSVLLNDGGRRFVDAEFVLGVEPRRDRRTHKPNFVLDCGGADAAHERCKGRTGKVTIVGALGSRSSAIFDLDGDGDLDIVTNEFNDVPQVLVSDLADAAPPRYLSIRLVGTESNRDGLGALVRVVTDGATFTRYHDGKSGYLSQSSLPLYVGLGAGQKVDRVEVVWPSGTRQTVTEGITVPGPLTITEPAPEG